MSTCRTLTLGRSFPMVNRPSKKFTVSAPYKRVLLRTCCWSTVEMHLICSWRTRSNSQIDLGAEELLPAEFAFCSCCFFFFFPLLSSFLSSFFLFPFFCFRAVFFFRLILLIVSYILNPVVFSVVQKSPARTLFPWNINSFFSLTVLCIFFTSCGPSYLKLYTSFLSDDDFVKKISDDNEKFQW